MVLNLPWMPCCLFLKLMFEHGSFSQMYQSCKTYGLTFASCSTSLSRAQALWFAHVSVMKTWIKHKLQWASSNFWLPSISLDGFLASTGEFLLCRNHKEIMNNSNLWLDKARKLVSSFKMPKRCRSWTPMRISNESLVFSQTKKLWRSRLVQSPNWERKSFA